MTSRERITRALAHQEPDRVPVDLGATESSGIMEIAYNRLKRGLGNGGRTQIYDLSQMIAKVEQPVLEAVGADAMPLLIEPKAWKPWTLQDGSPAEIPQKLKIRELENGDLVQLTKDGVVVSRCPAGGLYFDTIYRLLEDATTVGEIDAGQAHFESFDWPSYLDEEYDDLRRKARNLYEQSDTFIVSNLWVRLLAAAETGIQERPDLLGRRMRYAKRAAVRKSRGGRGRGETTAVPGGGFVFTQVHNIQAGVPMENVVAMYEAVEKVGGYPIS